MSGKEGITNISCVQKKWEDVDLSQDLDGQYDVVIASLSLTMHDIRAALEKMDAASRKYVYLFWFVDMPFWERMYADLWEPLHGSPYIPAQKPTVSLAFSTRWASTQTSRCCRSTKITGSLRGMR